jgi:hypothetical protein
MTNDVRVRAETPMLGLGWHEEITLTRTPLIEAAIADGRFTVLDAGGEEQPLKGAALDAALDAAGLPTTGKAEDKRARLDAHREAQAEAAAGPGPVEPEGTPATASTAAPAGAEALPAVPPVRTPRRPR